MAKTLPHLLLLNAHEAAVTLKQKSRNPGPEEEAPQELSEAEIADRNALFIASLARFATQLQQREKERDIYVPAVLTSIEIEFYSWFDAATYETRYYSRFGLRLNKYSEYNTRGLFTVVDREKFDKFLNEFEKFIACKNHTKPTYNKLIKFVKSFDFHSSERITAHVREDERDTVYLSMVSVGAETGLARREYDIIDESLNSYLTNIKAVYSFNNFTNAYEVKGLSNDVVAAIARNFDSVHTINSSSYGVIRPSNFGTAVRAYPFTVVADADLPIIGVIDTGVSINTPLSTVLIAGDYSVDGQDSTYDATGHGTAVAGFAALGDQLVGNVSGQLKADARILPIKVLGGNNGYISHQDVGNLIIRANRELGVRIFVLTVCYSRHLRNDEAHSDYAYYLDQLAQQFNVLIIISTGNSNFNLSSPEYPKHYLAEETNICSPAESMNNLTVGAVGSNLEDVPITHEKYSFTSELLPAPYSRKFHFDAKKWKQRNKRLFKPDVVHAGGNYTLIQHPYGEFLEEADVAGIQYISIEPGQFFERGIGTSYSAPLVANIAAKLMRKYPTLRMQTIKALIINGATEVVLDEYSNVLSKHHQRSVAGNGVPEIDTCLCSENSEATIIIEDVVRVGTMEAIPITIPPYLQQAHKSRALLEVIATLCFAIKPVMNYPRAYCPVNIAFGLFRSTELEAFTEQVKEDGTKKQIRVGINGGSPNNFKFKESWSQDAYYKSKPLTNSQKMSFFISREDLQQENSQFKLALECHFHKLLPEAVKSTLPKEYEYSLVLRFRENTTSVKQKQSLYNQLQLCNNMEALLTGDTELDAEANASF
ncbi:MAG: S8 family peptidase [Janthinobacterium lividum]